MSAAFEVTSHSDIAVFRFGHISKGVSFSTARLWTGEAIALEAKALQTSSGGIGKVPRTAGNLILSGARFVELSAEIDTVDDTTKLGRAVFSAELVGGYGILGITHADRRYDSRANCCNIVSLVAKGGSAGYDHLNEVSHEALTNPAQLLADLHEALGDEAIPAGLAVGNLATYDVANRTYRLIPAQS